MKFDSVREHVRRMIGIFWNNWYAVVVSVDVMLNYVL